MNEQDLFDGVTEVRDDLIDGARPQQRKKSRRPRRGAAILAACLAAALCLGVAAVPKLLHPAASLPQAPTTVKKELASFALAAAVYPEMVPYPEVSADWEYDERDYEAWRASLDAQRRPADYADGLQPLFADLIRELLSPEGDENRLCSPVNLYMALAMLTELTAGESREQLTALLGTEDPAAIRQQAGDVWNANYRNDGIETRLMANSVWLSDAMEYRAQPLEALAQDYYASVFRGTMGSSEYDAALQEWTNLQTGDLLQEQASGLNFSAETVLKLMSTVYYTGKWDLPFRADNNEQTVFHGPSGDVPCELMRRTFYENIYFWGERFSACSLWIGSEQMVFLLPDEGFTPRQLLQEEEVLAFLTGEQPEENWRKMDIHLALPKFDAESRLSAKEALEALGVTDVFDRERADFSPVTEAKPVWAEDVIHGVRLKVDEEGCEAASYVEIEFPSECPAEECKEITLRFDRPFLFVLQGAGGVPLFVGTVQQP